MNTEEKKTQKVLYPNQLNITIRTSLPGYQKFTYKPSMTIKDSSEKSVNFNPLIKLNQTAIDKIPQEYRIKEFFNKGLFQSLINSTGQTPAKSLVQATRYGYVDNNINVTLNSIFPTGSVIYIDKKPYVIADHQWTTGDWKVDLKQKKQEIDPNKVSDPQLYTQLVKDEIISGEEQLNQLPQSIVVGNNYSGPPLEYGKKIETAAGPPISPPSKQLAITQPTGPTPSKQLAIEPPPSKQLTIEPPPSKQLAIKSPTEPPSKQLTIEPPPSKQLAIKSPTEPPSKQLAIEPPIESKKAEEISPEEDRLFETFQQDFQSNTKNTNFFRSYFKSKPYKFIATSIFNNFPSDIRKSVKAFYSYVTNSEPRIKKEGLSNQLYEKTCDQVSIIKGPSDGDCFFKAVADGINIYNYENQDSKIYSGNYGKTLLYTTAFIRELVARYINNLGDKTINNMLLIAEEQLNKLNDKFSNSIEGLKQKLDGSELTQEQYVSELNNTYFSESNFLIYNPGKIPIDINNYNKPFRVIKKPEVYNYIISKNYWANDIAIDAICSTLKICVIPIEKYEYQKTFGKVRIQSKMVDRLKALLLNKDLANEKCSNNIMFLLYENNHYDLIRFTYFIKPNTKIFGEGIRKQTIYEKKWFTIFKSKGLPPPFHILILIYGTIYSTINKLYRENFNIFKNLIESIDSSVLKIESTPNWELFKTSFDDMFPNKDSIEVRIKPEKKDDTDDNVNSIKSLSKINRIDGGAPNYTPNYSNQYDYSRAANIMKKPDEVDSSKIAYSIIIDMEIHPGTSLTPEQLQNSKCNSKYNAIRKAFSEFTGKPYTMQPVYPESKNNTKKNVVKTKGGKRKTRKNL